LAVETAHWGPAPWTMSANIHATAAATAVQWLAPQLTVVGTNKLKRFRHSVWYWVFIVYIVYRHSDLNMDVSYSQSSTISQKVSKCKLQESLPHMLADICNRGVCFSVRQGLNLQRLFDKYQTPKGAESFLGIQVS
jgi:hypothetical protein